MPKVPEGPWDVACSATYSRSQGVSYWLLELLGGAITQAPLLPRFSLSYRVHTRRGGFWSFRVGVGDHLGWPICPSQCAEVPQPSLLRILVRAGLAWDPQREAISCTCAEFMTTAHVVFTFNYDYHHVGRRGYHHRKLSFWARP